MSEIQEKIDEYLEFAEEEFDSRGRAYEKFGSGINDALEPACKAVVILRESNPELALTLIKAFFE